MKYIVFSFLLAPCFLWAQNTFAVHIYNVASSSGAIKAAVYGSDAGFLTKDGVITTSSASARKGKVTLQFEDLPEGEYALAVFHDENGNGKLDRNWLGVPSEKIGFSKGKMRAFGPPRYSECAFTVTSDYEIDIVL